MMASRMETNNRARVGLVIARAMLARDEPRSTNCTNLYNFWTSRRATQRNGRLSNT